MRFTYYSRLLQWVKQAWATLGKSDRISAGALIVSAAALIVSLVAIWLGVQESRRSREHDRLSVVPMLDTKFMNGGDGEVTGIVLENQGLGPAHVLNVRLSTGSMPAADIYGDEQWQTAFKELGSPPPDMHIHNFITRTDFFIPAGKSIPLLWQRNSERTDSGVAYLMKAEQHVMISSCFCSLYDEC